MKITDRILYCKKIYTAEDFAAAFTDEDIDVALHTMNCLISQGRAKLVDTERSSKEKKGIDRAEKQNSLVEQAELYDQYDDQMKTYALQKNRENRGIYESVELDFPHLGKAQEFQGYVIDEYRLDTEVILKGDCVTLKIYNIADNEWIRLEKKYALENKIGKAVSSVDTVATKTTGAVDYTARKVIAPTVQVGAKAGVSILKTLAITTAKATGTIVSAVTAGSKQCVQEIRTDSDVLKATRDLVSVKDATMRTVRSYGNNTAMSSGARVNM